MHKCIADNLYADDISQTNSVSVSYTHLVGQHTAAASFRKLPEQSCQPLVALHIESLLGIGLKGGRI